VCGVYGRGSRGVAAVTPATPFAVAAPFGSWPTEDREDAIDRGDVFEGSSRQGQVTAAGKTATTRCAIDKTRFASVAKTRLRPTRTVDRASTADVGTVG